MNPHHPRPRETAPGPIDPPAPLIRTDVTTVSRLDLALMGGKDTYDVDRVVAGLLPPTMGGVPFERLAFQMRAARWMTANHVTQGLLLGTGGYPENPLGAEVHEVLSACVYVDPDPVAIRHGQALRHESPGHVVGHVNARPREVEFVVTEGAEVLDWTQPIGVFTSLSLMGERSEAVALLRRYRRRLAVGSLVVFSFAGEKLADEAKIWTENTPTTMTVRSKDTVLGLLGEVPNLDLVAPGIVPITEWGMPLLVRHTGEYAGIARVTPN